MRSLLQSPDTQFILEAHNALSAQIAEEAGFPGIWVSSLTMSSSWGVRDKNELTMSLVLDIVESMAERVSIPILFDGDTGYGSFNHFQQLVRRLEKRGCNGVCIEDKMFPKTNSFIDSHQQALCSVEDFCVKIKAGKDVQRSSDFAIIARTEALITGKGIDEALFRAHSYVEAGADAILVHSKHHDISQVQDFLQYWDGRAPVVCVPTMYSSTPNNVFAELDISLVIWANHMLRTSLASMQGLAKKLYHSTCGAEVENNIAPLEEIFRLQDAHGYAKMEDLYKSAILNKI